MQVRKASDFLSLVAFSGLVAGPSWAGQVFDKAGESGDKAGNPEAKRQAPKYYRASAEVPCETSDC